MTNLQTEKRENTMFKEIEQILAEIDATLNQLITNTKMIRDVPMKELSGSELQAIHNTQESLLARLVHTSDLINERDRRKMQTQKENPLIPLHEKIKKFSQLNALVIEKISSHLQAMVPGANKKPRIGKNRKGLKIS